MTTHGTCVTARAKSSRTGIGACWFVPLSHVMLGRGICSYSRDCGVLSTVWGCVQKMLLGERRVQSGHYPVPWGHMLEFVANLIFCWCIPA